VYEDSTAVLGPLSRTIEPHAYDLCREHATRMTAPRGWEMLRVAGGEDVSDDLVALADAVNPRAASSWSTSAKTSADSSPSLAPRAATGKRPSAEPGSVPDRHLHVVRSADD
jgi:Protein of unknown function (DUF3499)